MQQVQAVFMTMYSGKNNYIQQMLGVSGTHFVAPGWLVLGVTVGTGVVQTLKIRHYNVTPDR